MKEKYVNDLPANAVITETFLVRSKELRAKKSGEPYLSLVLSDKTGELDAKMWDNVEEFAPLFDKEDFIRVKGLLQIYRNRRQLTIHKLRRVEEQEIDFADFFPATEKDVDLMYQELLEVVAGFENAPLRRVMEELLFDEEVMRRLKRAPAAKSMHHAFLGGLLEHIVSLCRLVRLVTQNYANLQVDLLMTGAILHDIGKIYELSYERGFGYTTEGQLLGHMILELEMINAIIARHPDFPPELKTQIAHLIISHHGEYAFGSPKLPMTVEALLLHKLDDLDSKVQAMQWLIAHDSAVKGDWTGFSPILQRPIYRGPKKTAAPASAEPAAEAQPEAVTEESSVKP
ncbi:MAG: OB-fold nucleic acid binding domain-containing protein [Acidobacteriia bacterium]|nr:OB-fold nucleic acid binding domain-containing protein [Terriglobia bacterium]